MQTGLLFVCVKMRGACWVFDCVCLCVFVSQALAVLVRVVAGLGPLSLRAQPPAQQNEAQQLQLFLGALPRTQPTGLDLGQALESMLALSLSRGHLESTLAAAQSLLQANHTLTLPVCVCARLCVSLSVCPDSCVC